MMTRRPSLRLIACALIAVVAAGLLSAHAASTQPVVRARRMSFHNRLLLNRAVVSGMARLDVMVLARESNGAIAAGATAEISALVTRLGGRVGRIERAVGYLRVEVPTERLLGLVASPAIETYQIASLSRGAWYRDGPPLSNASMYRDYEVTPVAASEAVVTHPELPLLSPAEARDRGFTADDIGAGQWLHDHPTFDGRGVTIALLENALPSFTDPTLGTALTLDGRPVAKLAGILNVINPDAPDDTRVRLDTPIDAPNRWFRVDRRTYILPRPGHYDFGVLEMAAGANVVHQFGVLEDRSTHEVWIDANGDASFQDEAPLADVNERFDPRVLKLRHPRPADVSFVMARGRQPHVVHIYMGKGSHQSMTLSVAAGSRTEGSLAYGVAPNARVLLVRISAADVSLATAFEGFIETAQRPDVDVISTSTGLGLIPDTSADFSATLMRRIVATYQKTIVFGAANTSLLLGSAHAAGTALSVGGILSPNTYAALYGGRALERLIVHPVSAAGPSIDGAVKPDFVTPVERLAADLPWNADVDAVPRNAPARRLPRGYQISCCTSATSPYAAGVAALLISAARQSNVSVSAERLSRALRSTAHLVPGFAPHQQGNGMLDVEAAWNELGSPIDPPEIIASAAIVHPLAQYAAHGSHGVGILEFEGWTAGKTATRTIVLRRQSGPALPLACRVEWSGDDGTFSSPVSVTLPLREDVPLPVQIVPKSSGAHSALLTLRDAVTGAFAFRTQATIVAAEEFDAMTGSLRVSGTVGLMRQSAHYVHVPAGVKALAFDLKVTRGVIRPTIVPASTLFSGYYMHVHPNNLDYLGAGSYHVVLPDPEPGTWTFRVDTGSTYFLIPGSPLKGDDSDAEYTLTMRTLRASVAAAVKPASGLTVELENRGGGIAQPVIEASGGYLTTHRDTFRGDGLPNVIDISVPAGSGTLSLQLRSEQTDINAELHLYDCTSGECFSYNIGFPAARAHTLVVRRPNAGRWVAAVNAAPFPTAGGAFVLDEVITSGPAVRRNAGTARAPGARWQQSIDRLPALPPLPGKTAILWIELLDAALERDQDEQPWTKTARFKLRDRPVALGTAIYRQ